MKNSTTLPISILIGMAFSCCLQLANAQIVYTDLNPDQAFFCSLNGCFQEYELDLDNDGSNDFTLSAIGDSPCGPWSRKRMVAAGTHKQNEIVNTSNYPSQLILGDTISSLSQWGIGGALAQYNNCGAPDGNWTGTGYLGLKLRKKGSDYFGWVSLGVSVNPYNCSFTVYGYAYNSVPDKPITAGQTCPPQAVISPAGPISFCVGDSVVLSSVNPGSNLSYQWKKDGINIAGATSKSYSAKLAGKYKVKVTDYANGCTATSLVVKVKVPCRMTNEEMNEVSDMSLKVYPNPVSELLVVSCLLSEDEHVELQIFDVQGRLIRTLTNYTMSKGGHTIIWNAKDENGNEVSDGIYFLRLQTENEVKTIPLAVVK